MTQKIITYYIPQNLNITKGKIYNLYLNKVNNLDLSSIISKKEVLSEKIPLTPQAPIIDLQSSSNNTNINLSQDDYNEILSLADATTKLYTQSQELVKKLTKGRN